MKFYFIKLIVILFFALPIAHAKTILVLGDSLSAAYGIAKDKGWVSLMAEEMQAQHKVINASISGNTTYDLLSRLPKTLQQHQADIVIIAIGGNDGLRGLPLSRMKNNIQQIIQQSKATKAQVLLVGIDMPPNFSEQYRQAFRAVYSDLAQQEKVALVPLLVAGFEEDLKAFQPDGIHPTVKQQPKILQNVMKQLKSLLH